MSLNSTSSPSSGVELSTQSTPLPQASHTQINMEDKQRPPVDRQESTSVFGTYDVFDHITGDGVFTGVDYEDRTKNPLYPSYELALNNRQLEIFKKHRARMEQERHDLYTLAYFNDECDHAENDWREVRSKLPPPDKRRSMAIRTEIKLCADAIDHYDREWDRYEEDVKKNLGLHVDPIITFKSIPWPFFRALSPIVRNTALGFQPSGFPHEPEQAKEELEAFIYHAVRHKRYMNRPLILEAEQRRWSPENYHELLRRVCSEDVGVVSAAYSYIVALLKGANDFRLEGCKNAMAYFVEEWNERERLREERRLGRL